MAIKIMNRRPLSVGNIKIGMKGEEVTSEKGNTYNKPEKIDYFRITTNERGDDKNYMLDDTLMDALKVDGGVCNSDGNLIGIPIRLFYDDIEKNFPHMLARFVNKKCVCSGDGETAWATINNGEKRECPCHYLGNGCKYTGTLYAMIEGATLYGQKLFGVFHSFRTGGEASVSTIFNCLTDIKAIAGGQLAFLPLMMVVQPFQTQHGISYLVGVLPRVEDESELIQIAQDRAENENEFTVQMRKFSGEQGAIEYRPESFGSDEEQAEFADEFFPGQVEAIPESSTVEVSLIKEPTNSETTACKTCGNQFLCDDDQKHCKSCLDAHHERQKAEVKSEVLPLAVDEFHKLKSTGLRMFVEDEKNYSRIDQSEYEVARQLFEKWHRVMNGESWPHLDMAHVARMNQEMTDAANEKRAKEEAEKRAKDEGGEPEKEGGARQEEKVVEGPRDEQIPFGGRREDLLKALGDLIDYDIIIWKDVFKNHGIVLPDLDMKNICKGPKRNSRKDWETLIKKFRADIEDFGFIDYALKTLDSRGNVNSWFSALEHFRIEMAKDIHQDDVGEFLEMVGFYAEPEIEDDIPF
jgi:hypothetical protein